MTPPRSQGWGPGTRLALLEASHASSPASAGFRRQMQNNPNCSQHHGGKSNLQHTPSLSRKEGCEARIPMTPRSPSPEPSSVFCTPAILNTTEEGRKVGGAPFPPAASKAHCRSHGPGSKAYPLMPELAGNQRNANPEAPTHVWQKEKSTSRG